MKAIYEIEIMREINGYCFLCWRKRTKQGKRLFDRFSDWHYAIGMDDKQFTKEVKKYNGFFIVNHSKGFNFNSTGFKSISDAENFLINVINPTIIASKLLGKRYVKDYVMTKYNSDGTYNRNTIRGIYSLEKSIEKFDIRGSLAVKV